MVRNSGFISPGIAGRIWRADTTPSALSTRPSAAVMAVQIFFSIDGRLSEPAIGALGVQRFEHRTSRFQIPCSDGRDTSSGSLLSPYPARADVTRRDADPTR